MVDLKPKYYENFSCIGSRCTDTCCQGWQVNVDQKCHNKYLKLKSKVNYKNLDSFLIKDQNPTPRHFSSLKMQKNELCPFLDRNRLCDIQKKFGKDYLPDTCKIFPRRTIDFDEIKVKTLSLACPEAAKLCLTKENSMDIKSEDSKERDFLNIVPSYLHNSFTVVGEKLFNKIYFLFKNKDLDLMSLLFVCEGILNKQKYLERNPEKIDLVFNFIVDESKKVDFFEFDKSKIKLNFLTDINTLIQNTNPNCSLKKILFKTHNELVKKKPGLEAIINFKKIEKKYYKNFEKKNYSILRNYFLNELLGHAQIFTNEIPNCRNRFYLTILCSVISKLITISFISENNKNLDKQIMVNAIQKVIKNFGAFVLVDRNHEYELHPEVYSALKRIDRNSVFNSLFLLFS